MDSCLQIAELKGLPAAAEGLNFVFSPLSLHAALSFTAAGARGETLQELLSFLRSPTIDHLHSASARLVESVGGGGGPELLFSFVNGIWVDRSMEINPSFLDVATSIYGAAAESIDFANQAPLARRKINDWIEDRTNGIIKNLIPDGSLDVSTRLVLANALYFKGMWKEKFYRSLTKDDKFYLLDGLSTVKVPFMSTREDQFISSYDGFKALRLPYKQQHEIKGNRGFSMLIFLPNERDGLHDLIRRLASDPHFIEKHIPHKRIKVREFMVPKFKLLFEFEASPVLSNLGVKSIFSPDADLKGMCLESTEGCGLYLSAIHHRAAIEVDEDGTAAAAATAVGISLFCYTPPANFVADHPFLFAVREDSTGYVLFFGQVVNPMA